MLAFKLGWGGKWEGGGLGRGCREEQGAFLSFRNKAYSLVLNLPTEEGINSHLSTFKVSQ